MISVTEKVVPHFRLLPSDFCLIEMFIFCFPMRKLLFFAALLLLCVADDDIYEMGTPLNPKENLPYNDDVIVKTLVGMTLLCVAVFYF